MKLYMLFLIHDYLTCVYTPESITVCSISEYLEEGMHAFYVSIRRLCPYSAAVSKFWTFQISEFTKECDLVFSRIYIYMLLGHLLSV